MASTPCAACKLLRRKCTQECVFAPYFPPTQPQKFIFVHRVFGASNVTKILNDLPPINREDAVTSLYFEAEARLRDPIYGCVGLISVLQQYYKNLQQNILTAKQELASYIGPNVPPCLPPPGNNPPPNFMTEPNLSHQHQLYPQDEQMHLFAADAQRMAAIGHHQQGMYNGYGIDNNGNQTVAGGSWSGPSLALGNFGDAYHMGQEPEHHDIINHDQLQTQLLLQPPKHEGHEQIEGQLLMHPMGQNHLYEDEEEEEIEPPINLRKPGDQENWNSD